MRPMSALLCGGNGAARFPEADGHDGPDRVKSTHCEMAECGQERTSTRRPRIAAKRSVTASLLKCLLLPGPHYGRFTLRRSAL